MGDKLTVEQAQVMIAAEHFIIIQVWWNGISSDDEENYDKRQFEASVQATNIPIEFCMDELKKHLVEQVDDVIAGVQAGHSLYLCQMSFCDSGPYALYSHDDFLGAGESDPYWELVSYELMSHEPIEAPEFEWDK
jgi:hypothetical protein